MYLITQSGVVISGVTYAKGDFAFWNGIAWGAIPAGYTDAVDTAYDNTGVNKPIDGGTAVTTVNVQEALTDIYEHKADLDANGKVPLSQLPATVVGGMHYMGTIDASTAPSYPANPAAGEYYIISAAGTIGGVAYEPGDWAVADVGGASAVWSRITGAVQIDGILVGPQTVGETPLTGTPRIVGASKIGVTASGGVITVAGQNLVDWATSTPNKIPKVTVQGTLGDSLVSDTGTTVEVAGDFQVGSALAPQTANLFGTLVLNATGVAGSQVAPVIQLDSANGAGNVQVVAPTALATPAIVTLPDVTGTLATLADVQAAQDSAVTGTVGAVPFFSDVHTLSDSKITQSPDTLTVNVNANLIATGAITAAVQVNLVNSGHQAQLVAPTLAADSVQTLPTFSGTLLNDSSTIDGGVFA
jgi:hypothetical protein